MNRDRLLALYEYALGAMQFWAAEADRLGVLLSEDERSLLAAKLDEAWRKIDAPPCQTAIPWLLSHKPSEK